MPTCLFWKASPARAAWALTYTPLPEKVMSFHWPRSMPVLLTSGIWQRIVDRASALGDDETTETCGRIMEELLVLERREVFGAIRGADHYQTLWERQRA